MSGTKEGALKAKQTIMKKHGSDFFKTIGSKGGKACVPKGFATNKELAREAGRKGGSVGGKARVKKGFATNPELASKVGKTGGTKSKRESNHMKLLRKLHASWLKDE